MSLLKKIGLGLVVVLLVLQAFRPEKNISDDHSKNIATLYPVSKEVDAILVKACNDCHSNNSKYPWYASVQPLAWWINDHIVDGKKHFNFNEFAILDENTLNDLSINILTKSPEIVSIISHIIVASCNIKNILLLDNQIIFLIDELVDVKN